jgi:NAD(P)H-dependent flavin oxidoreductase YrpB (nitropropane dioxygenase family)
MTNNNTSAENVSKTLYTPLSDLLRIRYPIIQAGMAGGFTTPELVAAVSNAGALGVLGANRLTPEQTRNQIRRIKKSRCRLHTFLSKLVSSLRRKCQCSALV